MYFLFFESSNVIDLILWILGVLIASRFIEPSYDFTIDLLKNNSGTLGKVYNAYTRSVGRIVFLKKKNRQKPLEKTGYEYKIIKIDNKILAYKSKIVRLDQNYWFKRVQGEITRVSGPNKSFTSYFKGYLKNEMSYLIWEESYKNEKGSFFLTSHFKIPKDSIKDIPGITLEEKDGIVTPSFTILSFIKTPYSSVRKLLKDEKLYIEYMSQLNFDYNSIKAGTAENNFISV